MMFKSGNKKVKYNDSSIDHNFESFIIKYYLDFSRLCVLKVDAS